MASEGKSRTKIDETPDQVVSSTTSRKGVSGFTLLVAALLSSAAFINNSSAAEAVPAGPLQLYQTDDEETDAQNEPKFSEVAAHRSEELVSSSKLPVYSSYDDTKEGEDKLRDRPLMRGITAMTNESYGDASIETSEDDRLLTNIRPFKRARERFFGEKAVAAPEPPTVETIDLEEKEITETVTPAAPPVITLASAELPPLDPEGAQEATEELATRADIDALREEAKGFAWKKGNVKITPYGFLNLSVSNDTQRAVPGEYILFLQNPDVDSSSDFTVDARTSRLGLKIEGPRVEPLNATLGGTAEFDFQGVTSGSKNKGGVQFRRAFAELLDVQHERRFVAGQDWEVISPGAPMMLNYLPAAFAGNIQYRRAQLRFEQGWSVSSDLHFLGQIAVCDNVLGDYTSTAGVSAASSGWPILEGRLATELFKDLRNGLPITVGVSGHIGEQYYKFSPISGVPLASTTERKAIKTWSANVDYDLPITDTLKFQGEYYRGSNLSSFCGGINQGVDLYRREGIDDYGWWMAVHKNWTKEFSSNVGYGVDRPEKSDLVGTSVASNGKSTARTKNEIYFVNFLYNWTANFMTGIEFSYWETGYQTTDVTSASPIILSDKTAKAVRTEFTTRLSF